MLGRVECCPVPYDGQRNREGSTVLAVHHAVIIGPRCGVKLWPAEIRAKRLRDVFSQVFCALSDRSTTLQIVVFLRAFVHLLAPLAGYRNARGGTGLPVLKGTTICVITRRGEWRTRSPKLNEGVQADRRCFGAAAGCVVPLLRDLSFSCPHFVGRISRSVHDGGGPGDPPHVGRGHKLRRLTVS